MRKVGLWCGRVCDLGCRRSSSCEAERCKGVVCERRDCPGLVMWEKNGQRADQETVKGRMSIGYGVSECVGVGVGVGVRVGARARKLELCCWCE